MRAWGRGSHPVIAGKGLRPARLKDRVSAAHQWKSLSHCYTLTLYNLLLVKVRMVRLSVCGSMTLLGVSEQAYIPEH